jgi:diguanylate cyclase (GGDEF)-like protein
MPDARRGRPAPTRTSPLDSNRDSVIRRLRTERDAQAALIREQAASLAHSRKTFQRASEAARIGVWECTLPDETLTWTDVVYDLFDLPRGAPLDRSRIVECYTEASQVKLKTLRDRAIAERSGFHLDAEIVTFQGRRRWLRLTATVECEDGRPVRIFGMKQDITEEKLLADRTRYLADFDAMTGLANRSQFQARLGELDDHPVGLMPSIGALLLIDLDGFKQVNDTFGHACGDACLREAARRLSEICRDADLVARIGGDEFAVLVGGQLDRRATGALADRIVEAMRRPIRSGGHMFRIGASVGIALSGACNASELFNRADSALYAAKAAGRGTFRTYGSAVTQGSIRILPDRAFVAIRR